MADLTPQASEFTDEKAHESYDLALGGILKFALGLTILCVVCMVGLRITLGRLENRRHAEEAKRPARLDADFATPRGGDLAENPARDRPDIRASELRRLQTYGFDEGRGVARVPIDRAIKIVAERGPAARSAAPSPASNAPAQAEAPR
ncbi:MAG: hypothetical protein U0800_15200 [Isosphaeraceae bacterium]